MLTIYGQNIQEYAKFSVKLVAELQPKYSTALFSDVGLQEDFSFSSV